MFYVLAVGAILGTSTLLIDMFVIYCAVSCSGDRIISYNKFKFKSNASQRMTKIEFNKANSCKLVLLLRKSLQFFSKIEKNNPPIRSSDKSRHSR